MVSVEVCIDSVTSYYEAALGGAKRVEVCSSLGEGGLTPTIGFARSLFNQKQLMINNTMYKSIPEIMIMIRPRDGDFVYSKEEVEVMKEDIRELKPFVDGVVLGCLTVENAIDVYLLFSLCQECYPLPVTFHRAIDCCDNLTEAVRTLTDLNYFITCHNSVGAGERSMQGMDDELCMTYDDNEREMITTFSPLPPSLLVRHPSFIIHHQSITDQPSSIINHPSSTIHRILTSGGEVTAIIGINVIKNMIKYSKLYNKYYYNMYKQYLCHRLKPIVVMGGCGLNSLNTLSFLNESLCEEIHGTFAKQLEFTGKGHPRDLSMLSHREDGLDSGVNSSTRMNPFVSACVRKQSNHEIIQSIVSGCP